jgi:hypothetical protein
MVNKIRPLTAEEVLAAMTDQRAQELGYPNADVYRLAYQLGCLAGEWRETKEERVVQEYYQLFQHLIELGWNPYLMEFTDLLPEELMPEFPETIAKPSLYKPE